MNTVREIPWPRILAEGTAIVVSILLAFSIQAWWDDRQDQNDERVILRSLQAEFDQVQSQIESVSRSVGATRDSAIQLLNAAVGSEITLTDREIDRLLYDQTWYISQAYLANHELNTMMSSGDISLISNIRL
jgi:DnaJ-domain-containing protein 1